MAMWSALLHPLLIAAALLYAPGGLIAIAARLPVRVVVALAPALSVAVIAGVGRGRILSFLHLFPVRYK